MAIEWNTLAYWGIPYLQAGPKEKQQFSLWHSIVSEHVIPSEVEGSEVCA